MPRKKTKRAHKSTTTSVHEQEGFARAIGVPEGGVPACSSSFMAHGYSISDFRGVITGGDRNAWFQFPPHGDRRAIEWETSAARSIQTTVFTWIGGSQARPSFRPAFPYDKATLSVNGKARLKFPVGCVEIGRASC